MASCRFITFSIFTLILYAKTASFSESEPTTLKLVHLLFRHGERTTARQTLYPKDPYFNLTYYPYGLGELTNKGKRTEYKLGKALRERYDEFLGATYTPDILEAFSSSTNRTKSSLQLVLAGLFPPVEDQIWECGLNWQPIPYTALPEDQDLIFLGLDNPKFASLLKEYVSSPKMVKEFQNYSEIFEYISEHTGKNVTNYWDIFSIYMCLKTEKEYGLKLPEWTNSVYPETLEDLTIKSYELLTATTEMRRFTSGTLLKKIVDDSDGKVFGSLVPESRKLFLYSGHELNIAHMLITLGVYEPHIPPYGAYLAFELHEIDGFEGFKIYYQDYSSSEPRLLKLLACDEFCPLDQFALLMEEYFPNPEN